MYKLMNPSLLLASALILIACGGQPSAAGSAPSTQPETRAPRGVDESRSFFVIEGAERAAVNPRVSVHVDPGSGEGLFNDGVTRYEIRMLPEPLAKDDLTIWISNLRADTPPGRVEVTDKLATPSVLVGVGRGLIKGYMEVLSGHLRLEELGDHISLTFEAELESQSALDQQRRGQRVTVRGRVVGAEIPPPAG